jgi:uncharacterized protein DUF4153
LVSDLTPSHAGQVSADGRWRWDGAAWQPVPLAPLPVWATARVRSKATWFALGATLAVGLLADQSLRTGKFGLAASLTLAALGVGLVAMLRRFESRVLVAGAVLLAGFFTLRASPWLLWPDLAGAILLLGAAASFAARGSLLDVGAAEIAARSFHAGIQLAAGAGYVARPAVEARGRLRHAAPVLRGVVIALPIAAVLGALLASADAVFASFFSLNFDFGALLLDAVFVAAGALAAAGLLRLCASEPLERVDGPVWRLGATETLVVLAVLDAVFAAFAVAQALAATGAAAEALRSAGVTYSDYARSGFFQLLWVSGITLALLVLFGRISNLRQRNSARAFVVLALVAIALTLLIDVVAFRRLSLYEEAYGFTMLRLYSHVFAVWLAVVFVVLALEFVGVWRSRRWFIGATATSAVVVLLVLNAVNPEALVVAFNTDHARIAHKIDSTYLADLSSDATPALLSSRAQIDPSLRTQITQAACAGPRAYAPPWGALNISDAQAAAARRSGC